MSEQEHPFELGAFVVDREADDPDPAVVINQPGVSADEWTVYIEDDTEVTAAEDNPAYDPRSEIIIVAFHDDLKETHPDYTGQYPLKLAALPHEGLSHYAFPAGRLAPMHSPPTEEVDSEDEDTEDDSDANEPVTLPEEMETLADRLQEKADVTPLLDEAPPTLQVEKLGLSYTIYPDGSIEPDDDGRLADRLRELTDEYLEADPENEEGEPVTP